MPAYLDTLNFLQAPQQTKSKKIKVIENEAREKGLSLPISTGNKGFALMQKMGYKEGMSLGKSGMHAPST